jgi:hypothetical protein
MIMSLIRFPSNGATGLKYGVPKDSSITRWINKKIIPNVKPTKPSQPVMNRRRYRIMRKGRVALYLGIV